MPDRLLTEGSFSSMKYKSVIFDLFGTLVNNRSVPEYERVLSDMATVLSVPSQKFVSLWGETYPKRATGFFPTLEANIKHICQILGLQVGPEQILVATQIRLDFTRHALKPRPEALEILTELRAVSCKTGLISNCAPDVPLLWPDTPFASLVDVPIFSCKVGLKKPDLRIYSLACQQLGMTPHDCVYVGDGGSYELSGAAQAGMQPILICLDQAAVSDPYRQEVKSWRGLTIASLKEVFVLVQN